MTTTDKLLQGKITLVTGASRGIGHGIAVGMAREGALVIGTATTQEGADRITQAFQNENVEGHGMVLNVNDTQSISDGYHG